MKILAIETSCDDTSLAIFEDENLLAMDTKSQIKTHNLTGGVVPEVAAREHANVIFDVLENVLKQSNTKLCEIEYIGVTAFPGLIPSLLTGLTLARTLGKILGIKVIELNHIEGHIFSNYLERNIDEIKFPAVCLTVSGGHNDVYYMENMWDFQKIGSSNDDAAGESYDKVAKMMGLGYPGGPIISKYASEFVGTTTELFPRVWLEKDKYEFSFSGLKSAVKREIDKRIIDNGKRIVDNTGKQENLDELNRLKKEGKVLLTENDKREISFEFQSAVNEVLAFKLINAGKKMRVSTIMLAGGVSANDNLKEKIEKLKDNNVVFLSPIKKLYSMDNAAMIGILAYYKILHGKM